MDPVRNPYTPNAGAQPPAVVGRDNQLSTFDLLLKRMTLGRTEQSMIITGLRGVGKTVLLGRFRETALSQDWVVVESEISKHDDTAFRRALTTKFRAALFELSPKARWNSKVKHAASVLKSFSVSIDPAGSLTFGMDVESHTGLADHGDLQLDVTDLLVAIGEAARSAERGVVMLFDEVQFLSSTQLEALISALHKTVQRGLPITMVGAGLPQIAELAGDARSYAERLFKFPRVETLTAPDAKRALADPADAEGVHFEDAALQRSIEVTEGYPYFIQELGYAVWGVATGDHVTFDDVESAIPLYEAKLDESFFRVRLDRATEVQRAYLRAMAELGPEPQKASEVARVMKRTSQQVAPTRAELIGMGLLWTPEYGYAAFTVPHFDQFMRRAVPVLEVPELRQRRRQAD